MEDGWKIFTKIVPNTTAVRGPEALRKRSLLFDFPRFFIMRRITKKLDPITNGGQENCKMELLY
jgi:hypothetical protein